MKILILLADLYSATGGIQTFNKCLIKALKELNTKNEFEITVYILNDKNITAESETSNVTFKCFNKSKISFALESILKSNQSDIVLFGHVNLSPLAIFTNNKARKFLFIHGIEVWKRLSPLKTLGIKKIERIISVSKFTQLQMEKFNNVSSKKFHILPDTIYENKQINYTDLKLPKGKMILTVSRLDKSDSYKNIDLLIKAIKDIIKEIPDVFLIIVGDGNDRSRLEGIARESDVSDKIIFTDRVSDDILQAYYKSCDIFILPSTNEGFGIVFLEAMYHSKPCIGANSGGVPEVISDNITGLLAKPNDQISLTENVIKLLKDDNLRNKMGKAGKERFEREFSFEQFKERLSNILCV